MDWITPEIAIGTHLDAHDPEVRTRHAFRAVISLDGSMTEDRALALGYDDCVSHHLIDGRGNDPVLFKRIVEDLSSMASSCTPVLVHCQAGRSRSVAVVAGFLVRANGWSAEAAFDFIARRRETAVQDGLPELVRGLRPR
jgi:protein-tyrosine phosphatase